MTNTSGKWQQIGTNKPIISQPLSKGHIKDPTSSFLFFKGKKINIFWKSPDHLLQCGTTEGATGLSGEKKGDGNQMWHHRRSNTTRWGKERWWESNVTPQEQQDSVGKRKVMGIKCDTTEGATGLSGEKKGDGNQMWHHRRSNTIQWGKERWWESTVTPQKEQQDSVGKRKVMGIKWQPCMKQNELHFKTITFLKQTGTPHNFK